MGNLHSSKIFGAFSILNLRISALAFSLINYTSVLRLMSKKGLPLESSNYSGYH